MNLVHWYDVMKLIDDLTIQIALSSVDISTKVIKFVTDIMSIVPSHIS